MIDEKSYTFSGKRIWGFSRFTSDCTIGHWWSLTGTRLDQKDDIADSCSQMTRRRSVVQYIDFLVSD
jgi:hypothetical protein